MHIHLTIEQIYGLGFLAFCILFGGVVWAVDFDLRRWKKERHQRIQDSFRSRYAAQQYRHTHSMEEK